MNFKKQVGLRIIPFFNGFVFGLGIIVSGLSSPLVILRFFSFNRSFDPSLGISLLTALFLNLSVGRGSVLPRVVVIEGIKKLKDSELQKKNLIGDKGLKGSLDGFLSSSQLIDKFKPLYSDDAFEVNITKELDYKLIFGSLLLGVGIGLCGVGVSSFFVGLCSFQLQFYCFGAGMALVLFMLSKLGFNFNWNECELKEIKN